MVKKTGNPAYLTSDQQSFQYYLLFSIKVNIIVFSVQYTYYVNKVINQSII